jgi:hypothetical protein
LGAELDEDGLRVTLRLDLGRNCERPTLATEVCDGPDDEGNECSTYNWNVGFVRIGERVFANTHLVDVDAEPLSNHAFNVIEIRDVTQLRAEIAAVDPGRLIELIDSARLAGRHKDGPHGEIIVVTASSRELADVVASEPRLFDSSTFQLDRSD